MDENSVEAFDEPIKLECLDYEFIGDDDNEVAKTDTEKVIDDEYSPIVKNKPLFKILNNPKLTIGRLILYKYAKDQNIDGLRVHLSRILIDNILSGTFYTDGFSLHKEQFEQLTCDILDIFPNEKASFYYKRSYEKVDTSSTPRKINCSGALYNAYINLREIGRLAGFVIAKKSSKKSIPVYAKYSFDLQCLYEIYDVRKSNKELLMKTWEDSFEHRHKIVFNTDNIISIISKYKILQSQLAPQLINFDFEIKYQSDVSNQLITKWPKVAKKILAIAKKLMILKSASMPTNKIKKKKTTVIEENLDKASEKGVKEIADSIKTEVVEKHKSSAIIIPNYLNIEEVFKHNNKIKKEEHVKALSFLLLPLLLNKYVLKGRSVWRPQRSDIVPSFIKHIKCHDELSSTIKEANEKSNERKLPVQPFIVFCGLLSDLNCCHVIIEQQVYDFKTPCESVDFLYKLFFIFKLDYPIACPHVWSFIQKFIYDMEKERKIVANPQIVELMTLLN